MVAPNRNEPSRPQIIIFDKSPSVRYTVGLVLGERYGVEGFGDIGEGLGRLEGAGADLVILGMESPFSSYVPFLQSVRKLRPCLPVLFLSTRKTRGGISLPLSESLMKPFFPEDLREKVEGLLFRGRWEGRSVSGSAVVSPLEDKVRNWIGSWRVSPGVREKVLKVCSLPISVLVEGEEGTGKRWVARGLHYLGSWKESVFVRFSGKGLEREGFLEGLRGRVRGEEFWRGLDIYIEDVEMLTWEMQGYLETEVEEGWVGSELGIGVEVPVRVLGSSGVDLRELVRGGEVRRGFGEMFWGVRLKMLPLRERVGEIGGMVGEILRERGIGKRVSGGALEELGGYEWPGNVEELEGLVLRTGMVVGGEEIGRGDWDWGFGEGRWGEERRAEGEKGAEVEEERVEGVEGKREEEKSGEFGVLSEEGERGRRGAEADGGVGESVEVLLSTLVHEVKNPLVAISTFAHLLPERYGEEEFRGEFSRLVGLEVRRLNGVLEMLLEYGQLGTPWPKEVDLQRRVLASLGEKKREIADKKIRIRTEGLERLPAIRFDEDQVKFVLRRVWESVLGREIENREAAVRGRLQRRGADEGEDWVELEIWYDGREGIVKDIHRVEVPGGRYDFEGLSLGLGLARRLMMRNQGEMQVYQEEEVGTTIILRYRKAN